MFIFVRQFLTLLWKCWILRKRHYVSTFFEIVLPLLTSLLIVWLNSKLNVFIPNPGKSGSEIMKNATIYKDPLWPEIGYYSRYEILFSPNDGFMPQICNEAKNLLNSSKVRSNFVGFPDENTLMAYYKSQLVNKTYTKSYAALIFHRKSLNDTSLNFDIRLNSYTVTATNRLFDTSEGPNGYSNYRLFTVIQKSVSEAYLKVVAKAKKAKNLNVMGYRFPYPPYIGTKMSLMIAVPIVIVLGFCVTSPIIVKRLADEKASRSRELFRLMGLSDWMFWSSTFTNYFAVYFLQAIALTVMYCTDFSGGGGAIMDYSNPVLVFALFLLYGMSFIVASMLLSIPCNRPVLGVILALLLWILSYFIPFAYTDSVVFSSIDVTSTERFRILSCLLPNMGLNAGIRIISQREAYGVGVTFENLFKPLPSGAFGSLSFGLVMILQLLSIFLMSVLIWYVEAVWPWQHGMPKPFYFPFLPSYWCPQTQKAYLTEEANSRKKSYFERQLSMSEVSVSIRHLRKEFGFGFGKKIAVSDASLDINHGQITVLLGHNGAGKTTTMHMITGLFPPTSGTVTVDGYDVATQTSQARRSISLCPQHNILYDELTVREHLALYAGIKGVAFADLEHEITKTAQQTDLSEKLNTSAKSLSGGMKRKLSLGIALIGNTKVVILDEPTSGMDPEARRNMWDLLLSVKRERTILLTTHYMEEADALGDRIAIMSSGEVKCCGTPMFLKNAFGAGYQLRIAKAPNFSKQSVTNVITRHFPEAAVTSEVEAEIIYTLEGSSTDRKTVTKRMPSFFEEFEAMKSQIGVASCGVSVATIEDVFLGVSRLEKSESGEALHDIPLGPIENRFNGSTDILHIDQSANFDRMNGLSLQLQRFKGLIIKRFNFSKRYIPMLIFQFIVPCAIFVLLLNIDRNLRMKKSTTKLELSLSQIYGNTTAFYATDKSMAKLPFIESYKEVLTSERATYFSIMHNTTSDRDTAVAIGESILSESRGLNAHEYSHKYLVGMDIGLTGKREMYANYWCNLKALHSPPIAMNMVYNAILKYLTASSKYSIQVSSQPLPSEYTQSDNSDLAFQVLWLILVSLSLPLFAASFVLFPIHERFSRSKLLQLMSGTHPALFWFASILFDFLTHLICCVIIYLTFLAMDTNGIFTGQFQTSASLVLVLISFGIATIPLTYVVSFLFDKPSSGFTVLVILSVILGTILATMDFGYSSLVVALPQYQENYDKFNRFAQIFPNFVFSKAIKKIYAAGSGKLTCRTTTPEDIIKKCDGYMSQAHFSKLYKFETALRCCPAANYSLICNNQDGENVYCQTWEKLFTFEEPGIMKECTTMLLDSLLFLALLAVFELRWYKFCSAICAWLTERCPWLGCLGCTSSPGDLSDNSGLDGDVVAEKNRIQSMVWRNNFGEEPLIVSGVAKTFGKFQAVKGLTFGIKPQECFGLLGVNGAGKTTTFRMLVGDLYPSAGNAYCGPFNILDSLRGFQNNVGYCPQFDALLDKLTGCEILYMFGRLRGIHEKFLSSRVNELLVMADLTKHSDKKTEDYSGGTKRKLALAVALIGSPTMLFLDEPSAGVDPEARRKLWKTLSYVRERYGCSIVLTSHGMDECEALCSRLAIMVNGEFKCIGSIQHLRSKFGQGYTINVKIKREKLSNDHIDTLKREMSHKVPSAIFRDMNETVVTIHVTDPAAKIGNLFKVMSELKEKLDLEDYAVSDTTLEQIFVAFAREQAVSGPQ